MAPKAVSLAFAGRKLTGPPEGYGKKKELQVKRWISGVPPPEDLDPAEIGSVATLAEVESSKEDLYRSLRDSTDGYGPPLPFTRPGPSRPLGPPQQQLPPQSPTRPNAGAAADSAAALTDATRRASVAADSSPLSAPPGRSGPVRQSSGAAAAAITTGGGTAAAAAAAADAAASGSSRSSLVGGTLPQRTSVELPAAGASFPGLAQPVPSHGRTSLTSPARDRPALLSQTGGTAAAGGAAGGGLGSTGAYAPLDLGLAGSVSGTGGGSAGADVGLAAAILVARVEATLPQDASGETKLRAALRLAVEEQQRQQDSFRQELAAVRAVAASAKSEVQERAAEVQAAVRRAAQAEEELGRARAEALAMRQQTQMLQIELEEGREGRDEQMARAQADLATALAQLKEQSARAHKAMDESAAEAAAARAMATALQREVAVLRRQQEQDKLRLEAMTLSLQGALEVERREVAALRQERDRVAAQLKAEAEARKAAEESERRALKLTAKQAETQEAVQAAAAAAQAARQRAAVAVQRVAVVRAANPSAAAADTTTAAAAETTPARTPARAATDGSRGASPRTGAQPPPAAAAMASPLRGRSGAAAAASPATGADAASPAAAARANGHRALSRGLAAERQQLGELVQMQRRAAAAAELADARAAEAALAAAPEYLRLLGLAFRAYIVGSGEAEELAGGPDRAQAAGGRARGAEAAAVPAAVLAAGLSSAGYRVYVDPLTLQRPPAQLPEVPSAPLVARAAAAVVIAAPGLLRRPLARGELCSAARHGCPLVVLSPPALGLEDLRAGEEPPLAGDLPALQLDMALEALREAWTSRITLSADAPAAVAAVAERLGLPDPSLALLPPEALRHLSVTRTGVMPDLAFLNAPPPLPPPLPLLPGGASGVAGTGAAAAAGLPGLQHLRLNFGGGAAEGSGGGGGGGTGPLVEMLCAVLRGNSTLTALTLRGCPAAAARTITEAILNSPVSRVATVTISSRVPVAQLAGRPGNRSQQQIVDLGGAGAGDGGGGAAAAVMEVPFTDEDAEVVAAALRARGAAEAAAEPPPPPPLLSVSLPPSCNLRLGAPAVDALAEALGSLPGLQSVNGVALQAAAAAAGAGGATAAASSSSPSAGRGMGGSVLDLSGSRCGPVVLALLARQLRASLAALQALNLTGCETGPVGAARLAEAGGGGAPRGTAGGGGGGGALAGLQTACLADNGLGPEGIDRLMSAMAGGGGGAGARAASGASGAGAGGCAILDVSLNYLEDAGCKVMARWLPALAASLRVLVLSHNGIGTEGARALAGALGACAGLEELHLAGNQLGDKAVRELQGALTRLTGLQVLQLQDNPRISPDGMAALSEALAALPSLRELDVSRSYAGDEGARHMAKALGSHPSLAVLALEGCKIRAEGAAHLAAALGATPPSRAAAGAARGAGPPAQTSAAAPPRLTHLGLGRNQIGDRGVAALAAALGRNAVLVSLDLRGNGVGLAGCRSLGVALRERNGTLRRLVMAGNEMEEDALQALEDLAATSRNVPTRSTAVAEGTATTRNTVAAAAVAAAATPQRRAPADPQPPAGNAVPAQPGDGGSKSGAGAGAAAAAAGGATRASPRLAATPSGRQLSVPPPRPAAVLSMTSEQRLLLKAEEAEEKMMLSAAALAAAEASLAGAGLRGLEHDGYGSRGLGAAGGSSSVGIMPPADEEDLEALLSRYRTQSAAEATTGSPAQSVTRGSRGSPGGGALLDLGYTGMSRAV